MISRPALFSLLFLPAVMSLAFAQPPTAPSTVVKAAPSPFGRRVAPPVALPPDPPQVTAQELQALTGGPTLVTFRGTDLNFAQVTSGLMEAAGLGKPDPGYGDEKPATTVDWNQTPFWVAAAQVEKQTGGRWDTRFRSKMILEPARVKSGNALGLGAQLAAQTPFVTLMATKIDRESNYTAALGATAAATAAAIVASDKTDLTLTAYFDPRLPVQASVIRDLKFLRQDAATPQFGPARNRYEMSNSRLPGMDGEGMISPKTVYLPERTAPGTVFSSISGVLHTVLISAQGTFQVPDLLASPEVSKVLDGKTYTFQKAALEGEQLTIRMNIVGGEERDALLRSIDGSYSTLRVLDATGRALSSGGVAMRGLTFTSGEFIFRIKNYRGEIAPGPYSLDWPITTQTRSLDVPFELRDIVVP